MRIAIIVNPISGRGGWRNPIGAARVAQARRLADRLGADADVVATTRADHAEALSREYVSRGFDRIVAWGGDGTVNEVAGPLIGSSAALGVIPSGSGDGLARSLGLPLTPDAALTQAVSPGSTLIDVGYLGDRHFINVAGIGFDAAVARDFNAGATRGAFGYVIRSVRKIWSYKAGFRRLQLDGVRLDGYRFLIAFANGRQYGNGLVLAASADVRDGWLDVVVIADGSPWQQIWRCRRLFFGTTRPARGVFRTRTRTANISGSPAVCHVDGETFETSAPIDVRIAPAALRVAGVR